MGGREWMKVKLEAKSCCRWFSLFFISFTILKQNKINKEIFHAVKIRTHTIHCSFAHASIPCKHSLRNGTKPK